MNNQVFKATTELAVGETTQKVNIQIDIENTFYQVSARDLTSPNYGIITVQRRNGVTESPQFSGIEDAGVHTTLLTAMINYIEGGVNDLITKIKAI